MGRVAGNLQGLVRIGIIFLIIPAVLSCTIKASLDDISEAELSFVEPTTNSFTNNTAYNFKVQINSTNKDITPDKATMQVFEGPDCDPTKVISENKLSADGSSVASAASTSALQDGKTYSARVVVANNDRIFQSKCSASVGVDTQNPNPVSVAYPTGNGFVSQKELLASWSTTTDNGISGLSEVPYRLRLFASTTCTGTPLQTVNSSVEQYKFKKLTQGITYVVQVSSVDKAGNESVLACSPYMEVDVNVPGFRLTDPTSIDGYSRVTSPNLSIDNDGAAAYWCFTPDTSFVPVAYTDACPSGTGTLSGWYTSRPTTLPIGSGDGLKVFNLWIFRADGSLISHNVASAAITLDQTPPGAFTVAGVGGLTDSVFDAYFTSSGQPEVKWNASSTAVDYTVDIRTSGGTLVCSMAGVTGTDLSFTGCPVLTNATTYKVRIKAFDVARNDTSAPDFNFTVDRDPPGAFTITGVSGGADVTVDHFFGNGSPTVNYSAAAGSSHYKVEIKDTGGITICSLGTKPDQSGYFNYAVESGVTCTGLVHGGTYQAFVSAFDDGENETQASNNGYSFQVDTVGPVVNYTSVPTTPTDNTFANFVFNYSDALSGMSSVQCQLDGGVYTACSGTRNYTGLAPGSHTLNVKATDMAGIITIQSNTWFVYGYTWITSGFAGCDAVQPTWSTGAFGACNAAQPAWQYSGWGSCSVACGGGTQSRTQSCPVVGGNQFRTVSCPISSGLEYRTVQCQRNDSVIVADSFCVTAKPALSQSCSRNDCAGAAPSTSQTCSRGGGSDCNSAQATSQSCNTQTCATMHAGLPVVGTFYSPWCPGTAVDGGACIIPVGMYCSDTTEWYSCY